ASPSAPGTFAAMVHVHYVDALGRRGSVPVVAEVPAPDGSPALVRLRLEAHPVATAGSATLLIENPDSHPIGGRRVVVLAGGLATDPETLPARVGAHGRTSVPLVLENRAALPSGTSPPSFSCTPRSRWPARRATPSAWYGTRATWPG